MNQCPLCQCQTNQPLCKKCAREWVSDLHEIYLLIPRVEALARKEERVGGREQGHANPAFAPTPVSLSAMDYLETVHASIDELATDCRVPHGERTPWRVIVKKLMVLGVRLGLGWTPVESREATRHLLAGLRLQTTPPEDRLIIGNCLNPACGSELHAVAGQSEVECPACRSVWAVEAVRRKRRERFEGQVLEATQGEASRWLKRKTGVYVERHIIAMWLQRGMLAGSRKIAKGRYEFDIGELLTLAESFKPRH